MKVLRRLALITVALSISGCTGSGSDAEKPTPVTNGAQSLKSVPVASAAKGTKPRFAKPHENPNGRVSDKFPNTVLISQDGGRYRFYEDLVRDKIVIIQFMYTTCTGI